MERWLLVLVLAILGFAHTTTIDSKTESGYLRCKEGLNCSIKEKAQKPAKLVKHSRKVKQND
jgi:hypothetical protein